MEIRNRLDGSFYARIAPIHLFHTLKFQESQIKDVGSGFKCFIVLLQMQMVEKGEPSCICVHMVIKVGPHHIFQ
jgi:hypothetical protein